eukprot:IDg19335t1
MSADAMRSHRSYARSRQAPPMHPPVCEARSAPRHEAPRRLCDRRDNKNVRWLLRATKTELRSRPRACVHACISALTR